MACEVACKMAFKTAFKMTFKGSVRDMVTVTAGKAWTASVPRLAGKRCFVRNPRCTIVARKPVQAWAQGFAC
jgi:hypothetical protein